MDLIGVLANLACHSQTCSTSPTRQTPHKLVDLLTCFGVVDFVGVDGDGEAVGAIIVAADEVVVGDVVVDDDGAHHFF